MTMDWETTDGDAANHDVEAGWAFLDHIEKATGKIPIIYGSPAFLRELGLPALFTRFPLWVAHYGVSQPLIPTPWKTWTFWQCNENANVAGIANPCDADFFNGTLEQLKLLK